MYINPTNNAPSRYTTQPVNWTRKSNSSSSGTSSDSTAISGPGQFFSQLQQMSTQNPAEFKQVMAQMAQKADSEAQTLGTSPQAQQLETMAGRVEQAAQTGDFASLLPQNASATNGAAQAPGTQAAHSGHHHHGGGSNLLSSLFSQMGTQLQNTAGLNPVAALGL